MSHPRNSFCSLVLPASLAVLAVLSGARAEFQHLSQSASGRDRKGEEERFDLRLKAKLVGHRYQISVVNFSPDGQFLATGAAREETTKLWHSRTGKLIAEVDGTINLARFPPIDHERASVFSPDGHILVTVRGKDAKLWDTATGRLISKLSGHEGDVCSAAFSPAGERLATGSKDGTVRLWNTTSGQLTRTLRVWRVKKIPGWRVVSRFFVVPVTVYLSFSPDGQKLLTTVEWEGSPAKLWNAETGQLLATLGEHTDDWKAGKGPPAVKGMFSADGEFIITENMWEVRLWDSTGFLRESFSSYGDLARFSPDGRLLAVVKSGERVGLLDVKTGNMQIPLESADLFALRVLFSPDGRTLVLGSKLVAIPSGRLIAELPLIYKDAGWLVGMLDFDVVSFHPNSKVLMGAHHKAVRFWDSATGQLIAEKAEARDPAAFSADGKLLVTTNKDKKSILLWEVRLSP